LSVTAQVFTCGHGNHAHSTVGFDEAVQGSRESDAVVVFL
jgi:hypothetical protein